MSRPSYLPSTSVDVSAHVYETCTFPTKVYATDNRATVAVRGCGGSVTIYADRAELVRLRDVFAEVVAELDAARARLVTELTTADTAV